MSPRQNQKITPNNLKSILENNLFGVDIDKEAVRVASFSLYLTMLDKIAPLEYWENEVRFPRLRNRQLIVADFFREDVVGFRTNIDDDTYDLVIGNAPWGKNSTKSSPFSRSWQNRPENKGKWETSYGNIGLLFLPKAARLTRSGGKIAMMQPAMPLLFNQSGPAIKFRENLFSEFKIEEIVNLSSLRFGLFKDAISPTCLITLRVLNPDNEPFSYICPKPSLSSEDNYHLIIEPQDINWIYPSEAISTFFVWATLMWGGRRDLALIKRLYKETTIEKLKTRGIAKVRQGVIRGDRRKVQEIIIDRKILQTCHATTNDFLFLDISKLPVNEDPETDSKASTDFSAFEAPQMIIKQSWHSTNSRFWAAIVKSNKNENQSIICSESYVSVHVDKVQASILESACLSYNSKLAVYYLFLSSGRFASYIPEVKPKDLLRVPVPECNSGLLSSINNFDAVDRQIYQAFNFKDSEKVLIEDLFRYTLPDFKGDSYSPGRQKTRREVRDLFEESVGNHSHPPLSTSLLKSSRDGWRRNALATLSNHLSNVSPGVYFS